MDNILLITIIGFAITVFGVVLQIYDKIPEKYGRKIWYRIFNKKFMIKIVTTRKYPKFDFKINDLKENIQTKVMENNTGIDDQKYGINYIQILIKNLQAPYLIKFMPEADPTHDDERITVTISLLGTINFRYNDNLDNRKYLSDIEEFFKIIESTYNIHSTFENYNLISTKSEYSGNETSNEIIKKDNSVINIGKNIINIHSTSLTKLYDVYKKNVSAI